jgi:DNA mismatch repair protein MutL
MANDGDRGRGSEATEGTGEGARIEVLPASLADQIAAGEVVERPGSIVKELVENAIDAGATRVEVELDGGGVERIRVIDDGRGIHRDDLLLAVTRHATSKLRTPEQLIEIHTLGFRGEALASIAAVARVEIRSRRAGEIVGHRWFNGTSRSPSIEPIGMPFGTQVEVGHLFAHVPARRKFLRSEATEVGHCVDAVVRAALVHPRVQFRVRHGGRELLELPACDQTGRVTTLLRRRGGSGPFMHFAAERAGVSVEGWFAPPGSATAQRSAGFVVVRRRVVHERTLAALLKQAYGDALPRAAQPVACLFVETPRGTVDVNVHPQKSEVRFANAQSVYAIVRELVDEGLAAASWRGGEGEGDPREAAAIPERDGSVRAALAGWSRREGLGAGALAAHDGEPTSARGSGYRLGTRAASSNYPAESIGFRAEVEQLRSSLAQVHRQTERSWTEPGLPLDVPPAPHAAAQARADASTPDDETPEPADGPKLLTCLPGQVALFELDGELLVADLRSVRAQLVRRRLLAELAATGPGKRAPAQGLLSPVVVRRQPHDRQRLLGASEALATLGLELEGFGDDAVLVRAVPAVLPKLLDATQLGALLDRLMPWLQLQDRASFVDAVAETEGLRTVDSSPRLARRWLADLLAEVRGPIDEVPGLRRWSVDELLEGSDG